MGEVKMAKKFIKIYSYIKIFFKKYIIKTYLLFIHYVTKKFNKGSS